MMEQTIIVKTFEPVNVDCDLTNVLGNYLTKSAAFNEEELSTLKTIVSNLNEYGFLKVYELIEYKEIFVDRNYSQNARKVIVNKDDKNRIIYADKFYEHLEKDDNVDSVMVMYLEDVKPEGFSWDNQKCVDDLIQWFADNTHSNVACVESIPNVLDVFLSKEQAEGQMQAYEGYYPERMEVKERNLFGSELQSLFKLLSLLNL